MVEFNVSLRPITDADEDFLCQLYRSTRLEEMAQSGWTQPQIDEFLKFQFQAQHKFYQETFTEAAYDIVLADGERAGRLYLDRREDEFRIIDIALLPAFRGKKIGYRLLRDILDEATAAKKCVRIHVESNNPALKLYERLGFEHVEDQGVYYLMEWWPKGCKPTKS